MQTSPCLLKKCYKSYCSQISMLWCSLMIIGEVWNCHHVIVGDNSKLHQLSLMNNITFKCFLINKSNN